MDDTTPLLTFSHFLPRIELLPEKRYLSLPTLHSCVGSTFLQRRLHQFTKSSTDQTDESAAEGRQHLHAFGHTHLSWDATIDGVRYVHVPLAYPREWEQRRRSLEIGSMRGEETVGRLPVCVWERPQEGADDGSSGSAGFPSRWLGGWWSKFYAVVPRRPWRNRMLAPWAAKRFR